MSSNQYEKYPQPSGSWDEGLSRSTDYESVHQTITPIPGEDGYAVYNQHTADYMQYMDDPQMSGEANQQQMCQQMYFQEGFSIGQIQGDVYPRGQFGQQLQYESPSMENTGSFQGHPYAQNVYLNPAESYPPVVSTTPPLTNQNQQLYHKPNQHYQQQQYVNPYQDSLEQNQQRQQQPLQHQPNNFQQHHEHQLLQNPHQQYQFQPQLQNQQHLEQHNQEVTPFQQQEQQLKQQQSLQKQPNKPLQQHQQQHQQQQPEPDQSQKTLPNPHQIQQQYQQQFQPDNLQPPPQQLIFQGQNQQNEMNSQNQSQQQYPDQQYYLSASGQFPQIHSDFVPSYPVNIPNTRSLQPQPKGQGYQNQQNPSINLQGQRPSFQIQSSPLKVQKYPNQQMQHQHLNPVLSNQPGLSAAYQVQPSPQGTRYPSPQIEHQDHNPILSNKPVVQVKPYVPQGQRYSNPSMHHLHENPSLSFQPGQSPAFQHQPYLPQGYQNPQIPQKHQTGIPEGQPPPYQTQQTQEEYQEYQEYPSSQQVFHQQQYQQDPPQEVLYRRTEEDMQVTDAERVLKGGPHKLQGNTLKVNPVPDSSAFDTEDNNTSAMEGDSDDQLDDKKLLVLDIAKKTTEDTLKNFLESKADADVCYVIWGRDKCSAVVAFKTKLDVQAVIEASKNSKVDGKKLKIKTVKRSRCVKVSGLSPQSTEDNVRYHFENKKRGGPVHTVELYNTTASALVRFENYGVAEKVCMHAHKMYQKDVDVEMYIDTPGFTQEELSSSSSYGAAEESEPSEMVESQKLLIQNLNPRTAKDSLNNFLEAKADFEVVDVKWGNRHVAAIVTFKDQPDLEKLKQSCRIKKLEGRTLTVEMVKRSKSVEVSRLPDNMTKDSVTFYFENKMKSGGGPIEEITMKPQQHAAVVKFEDFGALERVCSKSDHKIGGKSVEVVLHEDIQGFTEAESDDEEQLSGSSMSETNLSWKVIIKGVEPLIIWYISKSEEEKRKLERDVQKSNGQIRYWRQEVGSSAEVSSIGAAKSLQKDSWKCQVQDAFRKAVDEMELEVENIDTSEARQGMTESLGHVVEDLKVQLCKVQQKICIVGRKDDVRRASLQVREPLAGSRESRVMKVKSFQAQYLKLSKVQKKAMENFPSVNIDVDSNGNKVIIEGLTRDLDQVQLWLQQKLSKVCSNSHYFKTDLAVGIMKSQSFQDKLKSRNTEFVWQSESPKSITLFSEREDDIDKAKELIKETVCEELIKLDQAAASNLETASWREEKRTLLQTHEGSIQMGEDSNTIAVAGTSDVFQKVIDNIDKFFEIRTVRHVLVPAEVPKVKFLRQHCMSKAKNTERNLLDKKVHIEFEEGSYTSGVKISGLEEGIAKARKEIKKLLNNIKCKDCKKSVPGISTFFKKGNGKEMLTGIEHNTNTVICPKEAHRRRKPLRTWTTSAGVVSVVKGDVCQMKVDAIVYAATKDLKLVTGLGKAIAEKGGKDIQEEGARFVKDKGQLSEGDVVCTGSGHLPCKHVLHAMLPKYKADTKGEHKIKTVLINILKRCDKKNIHSIGLPALGSSNGYPLEEVVEVIVETLSQEWTSSLGVEVREVVLCDLKLASTKLFIKTCDAVFAGARPRHQTTEVDEDEDDSASSRSRTESGSDSSGSDKASSRGRITVETGELSKQKADVVVNPTNKELNLSVGAVSKSLLEDGGHGIQTECKEKYPSGINPGEVASTKGGKLKCKEIFHGVLQMWKKEGSDRAESVLASLVKKCLEKGDSRGYNYIVFPALGTGKLGFPADVSARLMYKTATDFLKNASSLRNITFVVHSRDTAVKKAFETEVYGHSSSRTSKPSSHYKTDHHRSQKGNNPDSFRFSGVEVKILQGDITLEKTNCIVSCCDESFELKRGALSRAVLAKAGHNLQEECSSKRDEFNDKKMVMTGAHKLSCKQLLHLKVQNSPRDWGTLFVEGLEKANDEGLKSISIPALGTGGQKMSPDKMASSLRYAVGKFAEKHKQPKLTLVRVVIFQESMVNTYKSVFAGHKPGAGAGHLKRDRHHRSAHGGEVPRRTNKAEDEIVLCVYSDSRDNIRQALERITLLCKEEFVEKEIGEYFEQIIKDLDGEEMSKLCDIADKHNVVLKRHQPAGILLQGRVKGVSEVHDKLTKRFTNIKKSILMKEEAKMVANLVQWSYVIGEKSMPFTIGLNCCLEKAYNEKKTTIEIKDVKGREYTVDLKKKVEHPKGGGKPIKIERCEKAIRAGLSKLVKGEKEALAGTKTQYFQLKPERNFKGDAEDLHFRTAETKFYRLLGAGAQYRVTMVEYVVNPGLRKKFRAAKDALKKKHGDDTSEPVLAFHGTDEGNISSICEGGFKKPGDKVLAAAPDSGWFGSGVFFSEFPEYSIKFIRGSSKLLLCQVILGHVYKCPGRIDGAKLQAGYDSHTSPDGQELIIFDTDCILPCYIVHYDQSAPPTKFRGKKTYFAL